MINLEIASEIRPPQNPPDSLVINPEDHLNKILALRIRYANLPPEDRFIPTPESSKVQIMPGLGRDEQLDKVGFNIPSEGVRLIRDYNRYLDEGKSVSEAWADTVSELELEVRSFVVEYIQTGTVLPHKHRIGVYQGRERMIGSNGIPVVEGIIESERKRAVLKSSEDVEETMIKKVQGSVSVVNSPVGPTGLMTQDGKPITYFDNQTMVFWINERGNLNGLTLATDLTEAQSRQLSIDLGVDKDKLIGNTQLDRVSNIVGNPAQLSFPSSAINPTEYVLDKILAIRGATPFRLVQADGSVEYRSVEQTTENIRQASGLLSFNKEIEGYLENLRSFALSREDQLGDFKIQKEIMKKIRETILKVTLNYLKENKPEMFLNKVNTANFDDSPYIVFTNSPSEEEIAIAMAFLQTRGGCAGGGSRSRGWNFGQRVINGSESLNLAGEDEYGSLEFPCPKCNRVNIRPRGQLIKNCQHCKADTSC